MHKISKQTYPSAEAVWPLLVGEEIPNVPLIRSDGLPCYLSELIKSKPSIVIFYRGGW